MPQKPIPLTNNQRSSLDELSGGSAIAMNAVVDKTGAVRRRPGLAPGNMPSAQINSNGINAIHCTYSGSIYALGRSVGTYDIYKLSAGGYSTLSTNYTTQLLGTSRPVIAETEAILAMSAGDLMQKVVLGTDISSRLGGTPPDATHVVPNRLRLIANDPKVDKSKLRYSDVATGSDYSGHEVWSFGGVGTAGYTSAEARPDPIVALAETADTVFAFGSNNLQIFVPDSNLVYAPATTLEVGCSAPYSVFRTGQAFAWLDNHRRFVVASGNEYKVISDDIASDIDGISTISDCFGFRLCIDKYELFVWKFPTDGRTFAYQVGGGWSQWSGYDSAAANWTPFIVNCHAHNDVTDANVVGTADGYAAEFDAGAYTDLGAPVRVYIESGFINRGTDNLKHCGAVHIKTRRSTDSSVTPSLNLSYCDQPGLWTPPIRIGMGYNDGRETVTTLRSLGTYRNRNWRIEYAENCDIVLSGITEDYNVLGA